MRIVGDLFYSYGWLLQEWQGHAVLANSGCIDGFNAHVALMPDQKLGFALLTNVTSSSLPTAAVKGKNPCADDSPPP